MLLNTCLHLSSKLDLAFQVPVKENVITSSSDKVMLGQYSA